MKHLLIRLESKLKNKVGRGTTVVMYNSATIAAYHILEAMLEKHGFIDEGFDLFFNQNSDSICIEANSDHDYYRWLDIINAPIYYITVEKDEDLEGTEVTGPVGAYRYKRDVVEMMGFSEELKPLKDIANIELVRTNKSAQLTSDLGEEGVPLVEIIGYGDEYDLPVGGFKPTSWLGRIFSFFGEMVKNTENQPMSVRKPFIVFESYLGGHVGIYKSLYTNQEVDVALFNRYGNLINVFSFQDGCPHTKGINGFTIEDLISIGTWRILHVNQIISSEENVKAVYHLNEAVEQLRIRMTKRAEQALADEEAAEKSEVTEGV